MRSCTMVSREISREEFADRIMNDTLTEVLNAVPVQKGDVLFIEAGTIHAIGKDILIAEIQQNSRSEEHTSELQSLSC